MACESFWTTSKKKKSSCITNRKVIKFLRHLCLARGNKLRKKSKQTVALRYSRKRPRKSLAKPIFPHQKCRALQWKYKIILLCKETLGPSQSPTGITQLKTNTAQPLSITRIHKTV